MKQLLNSLDTFTRRKFVERCAATSFGLSVLQAAPLAAADPADSEARCLR